ncbi:Vacuolar morphogenesis protein 6 [Blastocladiella emersonii ATCC 22665]|nr:Vacuolar morphogenesis protein 6 [Blastocladiella emersonii ATCC 22665]
MEGTTSSLSGPRALLSYLYKLDGSPEHNPIVFRYLGWVFKVDPAAALEFVQDCRIEASSFARPATIGCKCAAADKAKFPCPTATSTIAARPTSAATATAVSANGLGEAGATGMNSGTLAAILGSVGGLVLICAAATAWWWMRRRRSAGKGYSRRRLSNDVADEAAAAGDLYSPVTPGSRSQDSPRTSTSRGRGPATPASPPAPTLHLDPAVSQELGKGIVSRFGDPTDIESTGTVRDAAVVAFVEP